MVVLIDSGPLGLISNPRMSHTAHACRNWADLLLKTGHVIVLPEIADYEVRRELIRAKKTSGIQRLDQLKSGLFFYLPLSTEAMLKAAEFWAQARNEGQPTAPNLALDGDVILAAQAWCMLQFDPSVVIATSNPKHLSRFVKAEEWQKIAP